LRILRLKSQIEAFRKEGLPSANDHQSPAVYKTDPLLLETGDWRLATTLMPPA